MNSENEDIDMNFCWEEEKHSIQNYLFNPVRSDRKIYSVFHPVKTISDYHNYKKNNRISQAEARIKNDLIEFETKRLTTGNFTIKLYNYSSTENGEDFLMKVDFIGLFTILIRFYKDYPFSPPSISYLSGHYLEIFDIEQNIKLPCLSKDKWSPVMSLNSLLFSIELLLIENKKASLFETFTENLGRKKKYWEFEKINKMYMDSSIIGPMEEKLKRLKISS